MNSFFRFVCILWISIEVNSDSVGILLVSIGIRFVCSEILCFFSEGVLCLVFSVVLILGFLIL